MTDPHKPWDTIDEPFDADLWRRLREHMSREEAVKLALRTGYDTHWTSGGEVAGYCFAFDVGDGGGMVAVAPLRSGGFDDE